MDDKQEFKLSSQAFRELKDIVEDEIDEDMEDTEIEEMGVRLLKLFSILATEKKDVNPAITLTDQERRVLKYMRDEIEKKRNPTVRDIAKLLGFTSSRSGAQCLNKMIEKGLLVRDKEGRLELS